jgi:hypothetical protein
MLAGTHHLSDAGQQVRFEPSGEWSLAGMTMPVNTACDNQRRNREFALFEKYYLRGLPNVEEVKHPDPFN